MCIKQMGHVLAAMSNMLATLSRAALLLVGVAATANADYRFFVSGWPTADESYSAASAGTSLVSGTLSAQADAVPLEARYRTWDESDGIALRSDRYRATLLIIK